MEYEGLLIDDADMPGQAALGDGVDVRAVEEDHAVLHLVQLHQQAEQRAFPAAAGAQQHAGGVGLQPEGNVVQQFAVVIGKRQVLDLDATGPVGDLPASKGLLPGAVQHLQNPSGLKISLHIIALHLGKIPDGLVHQALVVEDDQQDDDRNFPGGKQPKGAQEDQDRIDQPLAVGAQAGEQHDVPDLFCVLPGQLGVDLLALPDHAVLDAQPLDILDAPDDLGGLAVQCLGEHLELFGVLQLHLDRQAVDQIQADNAKGEHQAALPALKIDDHQKSAVGEQVHQRAGDVLQKIADLLGVVVEALQIIAGVPLLDHLIPGIQRAGQDIPADLLGHPVADDR